MHLRIEAATVEELPILDKSLRPMTAIVGKGYMRKMYMYLWITTKEDPVGYGLWKFACYPSKS